MTSVILFDKNFSFDDAPPPLKVIEPKVLNEKDITISNFGIESLIQKYRKECKNDQLPEEIEENIELDNEENTPTCILEDSVREKGSKSKKRPADEDIEDEKYTFTQTVTQYKDVASFIELQLSKPVLKGLNDMKLDKPTPIQSACIPIGLLNRDICACARTGSGKTLAFLIPILERMVLKPFHSRSVTRALVISPTRELAVQIFNVAEQLVKYCPKVKIQLSAGGLDRGQQEVSLRSNPDLVIATPGRLIDHISNAPNFSLSTVEYLVLDEADKLLDEYFTEQVTEIVKHCGRQRQTLLFSATMTESVRELATMSLRDPIRVFLNQTSTVARRLHQEFVRIRPQHEERREAVLAALLIRNFRRRTIVFLPTKRLCHRVHVLLGLMGLSCAELHGDMTQAQRLEALRRFTETTLLPLADKAVSGKMQSQTNATAESKHKKGLVGKKQKSTNEKNDFKDMEINMNVGKSDAPKTSDLPRVDILLATDLAARGLDIPDVQTVINYSMPPTMKQYVHRVGRTARAANAGRAVSLVLESDRKVLKQIVKEAPYPVKARVIPQNVLSRFVTRVKSLEPVVQQVLLAETEERELRSATSQLARTERLYTEMTSGTHGGGVMTTAPRVNWFNEKKAEARRTEQIKRQKKHEEGKQPRKKKKKKDKDV